MTPFMIKMCRPEEVQASFGMQAWSFKAEVDRRGREGSSSRSGKVCFLSDFCFYKILCTTTVVLEPLAGLPDHADSQVGLENLCM